MQSRYKASQLQKKDSHPRSTLKKFFVSALPGDKNKTQKLRFERIFVINLDIFLKFQKFS